MARIIGTGSFMPKSVMTNKDFEKYVNTNDEWIVTRTGIKTRHFSNQDENTGDLGYEAGLRAIEDAKISPLDLDYIIVATTTPHALLPNTSSFIQGKLGAKKAACFDINAACSGFIYGLEMAEALLMLPKKKNILLIGAEVLSKITDFTDRRTCVLFGDGAGACVLTKGVGIKATLTGADGEKGECLKTETFEVNNLLYPGEKSNHYISMMGQDVYKFAVKILPYAVTAVLEDAKVDINDITHIIPHQANIRIIEAAAKRLNVPMGKFFVNIESTGNTSAASIPIALDEMNRAGSLKEGDKIALVGFGGGLTYGAAYLEWHSL